MPTEHTLENRTQFQLERIILFSDAVFAIAITLLIIEIKIPDFGNLHHAAEMEVKIRTLFPKLIGFVFSFILIGIYWMAHHRLFKYINNYSTYLIWLNLFLLMAIVLMPFTTALAFEGRGDDIDITFLIYSINQIIIGILFYFMWKRLGNKKLHTVTSLKNKSLIDYYCWRSLALVGSFLIVCGACFMNARLARFSPIVIPLAIKIVNIKFKVKKENKEFLA